MIWSFLKSLFVVTKAAAEPVKKATPAVALAAAAFISGFEGVDLIAKHYAHDPDDVITYCQGLTNLSENKNVKVGDRFTLEFCNKKFATVLPRYWAMVVRQIPSANTMPLNRQKALLSFTFNVGEGNLQKSSVRRYLNAGNIQKGCDALLLYNRANGKVLRGLINRREAERKLCLAS